MSHPCCVISPKQNPLTPSHCTNLNSRGAWVDYVALWSTSHTFCFLCATVEFLSKEQLLCCWCYVGTLYDLAVFSLCEHASLYFLVKVFRWDWRLSNSINLNVLLELPELLRLYSNCMNINLLCSLNTKQLENECSGLEINVNSICDVVRRVCWKHAEAFSLADIHVQGFRKSNNPRRYIFTTNGAV